MGHLHTKNESKHRIYILLKINSILIIHLKYNMKLKLLEDNIIENIDDIGYGNNFVDTTPKE